MKTNLKISYYAAGAAMLCMLALSPVRALAGGRLTRSANGRYFTDDTGKAIYLTGSHTWNNFLDGGWAAEGWSNLNTFNYETYLDWMREHHHNFIRLWTSENVRDFEPCTTGPSDPSCVCLANNPTCPSGSPGYRPLQNPVTPTVYERVTCETSNCYGADGLKKFDLSRFNSAYFDRLRQHIIEAGERNIYVSIMLFNAWGIGIYAPTLPTLVTSFMAPSGGKVTLTILITI
jgi:hypothetical protein